MAYTAEQKKAWSKAKKAELDNTLKSFLQEALETKDGMDKLSAHYRIQGLYQYSFKNSALIMAQGGTICQSHANWKRCGREVKSIADGGSAYIRIYRPIIKTIELSDGTEDTKLIGWSLSPTFDIEQTTGKELEYEHNSQDGQVDYSKIKTAMEALTGSPVTEEYTGKARGYSNGEKNVVSKMSNDTDKVKTLFHEVGHYYLHTSKNVNRNEVSHEAREVEAESVAYLVLSYLGVDYELTTEYVANYKAGIAEARTSRIVEVADKIIKAIKD